MTQHNFGTHNRLSLTAVLAAGLLAAASSAWAYDNPVDPVSNPQGLQFSDVEMDMPKYAAPFQRTGRTGDKAVFAEIVAGLPASQVQSLLGQPLAKTQGKQGSEWNYNFVLRLPQSENHIVCQYKVVFDDNQQVSETTWRRDQCLNIAQQAAG